MALKEAAVKHKPILTALVFTLLLGLTSCGHESETITGNNPQPGPGPAPGPGYNPAAPGLVGTFSGTVTDLSHTKSGTLTITITAFDRSSGSLTGALKLTGFPGCFTAGVFPDPKISKHRSHYSPQNGRGMILAGGSRPGSYSYLSFNGSNDFNKGLYLDDLDGLGFNDGVNWCLGIYAAVLTKTVELR